MRAEAFRQFQEPTQPRHATEFATAAQRPDPVHELSLVLARLVETQQLLIKEVREVAQRPDAPRDDACDDIGEEPGGGTIVTYDWAPSPVTSPW
jgi:hypothetical protein